MRLLSFDPAVSMNLKLDYSRLIGAHYLLFFLLISCFFFDTLFFYTSKKTGGRRGGGGGTQTPSFLPHPFFILWMTLYFFRVSGEWPISKRKAKPL